VPDADEIWLPADQPAPAASLPSRDRPVRSELLDDFLTRIDRYAETRDYPAVQAAPAT
jgi:hypothetical protein